MRILLVLCLLLSKPAYSNLLCEIEFLHKKLNLDKPMIIKAYKFAKAAHAPVVRKITNQPYFTHPHRVASNVLNYTNDSDLIIAALLHDIIEDVGHSAKTLEQLFNKRISNLVMELTSNPKVIKSMGKTDYMAIKFNQISEDALLVKLLDRLDNMSDLHLGNKDFAIKYVNSTERIILSLNRDLSPSHIKIINQIKKRINKLRSL